MPILNGVKMACEPCIRGHRSTKCSHEGDRLLVEVRKPGRPLASCPGHVPGQECRCSRGPAGLLTAFPKKSRCGECGDKGAASVKTEQSVNPGALLSPSRSSFRVNKANGRPSSRKQSYSTAIDHIEQIDPTTYNVISNGVPTGMPMEHAFMNFEAQPPYQPPMMGPMYPASYSYAVPTIPPSHHDGNMMGHPTIPMNGDLVTAPGSGTPEGTVGYSSGPSNVAFTPSMSAAPSARANPPTTQRSCCAPKPVAEDIPEMNGYNSIPVPSAGHHTSPQPPTAAPQHLEIYPSAIHGNSYGTFQSPLQYKQWEAGHYENSLAQQASTQGALPYACSCGSACACLACPIHIFNPTNLGTVAEVYRLGQEYQDPMLSFEDGTSAALQDGNPPFATQSSTPEAGSHVTSSMEGSPAQPASVEDYIWARVPCHGDESSCQCGDDCACDGCLDHIGNKEVAKSLSTEENNDNLDLDV